MNIVTAAIGLRVWTRIHPSKYPQFMTVQVTAVVSSGGGLAISLYRLSLNTKVISLQTCLCDIIIKRA